MARPPNLRQEPRREIYEGVDCVWIQRSNGSWTLIEEADLTLVASYPWYELKGYSHWESPDGKTVAMQNVIMPPLPGMITDHANGRRWDNRRSNLRPATLSQNQWNKDKSKNNTSGYPGVRKKRDKWQARITMYGKEMSVGVFGTFELAVAARKEAEIKYRGEYRRTA